MKKLLFIFLVWTASGWGQNVSSLTCKALKAAASAILSGKAELKDVRPVDLQPAVSYLVKTGNDPDQAIFLVMYEEMQQKNSLREKFPLAVLPKSGGLALSEHQKAIIHTAEPIGKLVLIKNLLLQCGADIAKADNLFRDLQRMNAPTLKRALDRLLFNITTKMSDLKLMEPAFKRVEMVKLLLMLGADPNYTSELVRYPGAYVKVDGTTDFSFLSHTIKETPLLRVILYSARYDTDAQAVLQLLLEYAADPNVVHEHPMRALDYAYKQGNSGIIELLKKYGAKDQLSDSYWNKVKNWFSKK